MTAPASTTDLCVDALITLIKGLTIVTPDVVVADGSPNAGQDKAPDIIVVGEHIEQIASLGVFRGDGGAGWLEETYKVRIVVSIYRGGDDATALRKRCVSFVNAIDAAVRADPSLGGVVLRAYPEAHTTTIAWDEEFTGRIATCEMYVRCDTTI